MNETRIHRADFVEGAASEKQFPPHSFPEIAFAGRSNVGKSSLINNLVHRKDLARVSNTPGKTQQINFYIIDEWFVLADLPGYGYAKTSKSNRLDWAKLNFSYLKNRPQLNLVCSLIDSRHDPQPNDLALIEWLEDNRKPFVIILTKSDKISKTQVKERHEQVKALTSKCEFCSDVLIYSSTNHVGREELFGVIKRVAIRGGSIIKESTPQPKDVT